MARLGEAHVEQIKVLLREGKKAREIVEVMDRTYPGVSFVPSQVYFIKKELKKGDAPGVIVKRHHKKQDSYTKLAFHGKGALTDAQVVKDILQLVSEIKGGYQQVIRHIRAELIISRTEVYAMRSGAGLPDIVSDIE